MSLSSLCDQESRGGPPWQWRQRDGMTGTEACPVGETGVEWLLHHPSLITVSAAASERLGEKATTPHVNMAAAGDEEGLRPWQESTGAEAGRLAPGPQP